jgi:hypothetical protein
MQEALSSVPCYCHLCHSWFFLMAASLGPYTYRYQGSTIYLNQSPYSYMTVTKASHLDQDEVISTSSRRLKLGQESTPLVPYNIKKGKKCVEVCLSYGLSNGEPVDQEVIRNAENILWL